MKYWLIKTEPGTYSWNDLVRENKGVWDGVRNAEARNNMKSMKSGDRLLVYHTGDEKAIVGIAEVTREAFPEPDAESPWVAIGLKPVKALMRSVALAEVKSDPALSNMALVRMSRLSVQPVEPAAFKHLMKCSGTVLS